MLSYVLIFEVWKTPALASSCEESPMSFPASFTSHCWWLSVHQLIQFHNSKFLFLYILLVKSSYFLAFFAVSSCLFLLLPVCLLFVIALQNLFVHSDCSLVLDTPEKAERINSSLRSLGFPFNHCTVHLAPSYGQCWKTQQTIQSAH